MNLKKTAFVNATLYPISSAPVKNGILLVEGGKILAAGSGFSAPGDAQVVDCQGRFVLPGFVDAHCHVGIWGEWYGGASQDGNESAGGPVHPEVKAIDSVWPDHFAFVDARAGGVTTVQVTPGSGNIVGGQTVVIKTVGSIADRMVVRDPAGMKAALGENPKWSSRMPSTRMGNAAVLRSALFKAQAYDKKLKAAEKDPAKQPDTDLGMLGLVKVIRKEIPLRVHAHRADDIVTAVRIAEEFDIDYSIEHCTDGIAVAEFLGKRRAKVNVGPAIWQRAKIETRCITPKTAGVLAEAGCKVSLISDHPFHPIQFMSTAAGVAWGSGMSEEHALRAVTLTPAETLGVADRVGSLEKGKDADFVIWTGHPFRIRSRIESVYIEGCKVPGN